MILFDGILLITLLGAVGLAIRDKNLIAFITAAACAYVEISALVYYLSSETRTWPLSSCLVSLGPLAPLLFLIGLPLAVFLLARKPRPESTEVLVVIPIIATVALFFAVLAVVSGAKSDPLGGY